MKTNILIWGIIALCSFQPLYSQVSEYDLGSFLLPDIDRQALDFDFDLSDLRNYQQVQFLDTIDASSNLFSGRLGMVYNRFHNTRSRQIDTELRGSFFMDRYALENDEVQTQSEFQWSPQVSIDRQDRYYMKNAHFIEIDQRLSIGSSFSEIEEDSISDFSSLTYGLGIQLPLAYGIGRIEFVEDARQAALIHKFLTKYERGSERRSESEINEFGELLSVLNQRRFFDSRLQLIHVIKQVDAFMKQKGYDTQCDATYFAVLSDMLAYGRGPRRGNGHRFRLGITPGFHYSENSINDAIIGADISSIDRFHNGIAYIEYERENARSLYIQHGFTVHAGYGYVHNLEDTGLPEHEYSRNQRLIRIGAEKSFGWHPDTRTSAVATAFVHGMKQGQLNTIEGGLRLQAYRYFSPRTRLALNYSLRIQDYKENSILYNGIDDFMIPRFFDEDADRISRNGISSFSSFNLRFTYSLF